MKKNSKVFLIALVLIFTFALTISYATPNIPITAYNGGATSTAGAILGFVQWIGYAIAIGMLIYIGIKYVTSPAAEKADVKQALVKYVIGAILIAGAATISGWVFKIVPQNNTGTQVVGGTGNPEIDGRRRKINFLFKEQERK